MKILSIYMGTIGRLLLQYLGILSYGKLIRVYLTEGSPITPSVTRSI